MPKFDQYLLIHLAIIVVIALGHFGWWIAVYNRLNATGLPRKWIKFLEKGIAFPLTIAIPLSVLVVDHAAILQWLQSQQMWPEGGTLLVPFSFFCIAFCAVAAPFWIYSRRRLIPPKALRSQVHRRDRLISTPTRPMCGDSLTERIAHLPGNEVLTIQTTIKKLVVPRWPGALHNFRIAQLSDIHLTGQLTKEFYQDAFANIAAYQPDMLVISGDIIDKEFCLDWIKPLLGDLTARCGKYYVLGNHDKRLSSDTVIRQAMAEAGWVDVSGRVLPLQIDSTPILLGGTERPWFGIEPQFPIAPASELTADIDWLPRLLISHSPDQIAFARRNQIDFMMAGHTHGGQIRFPLIGPVVAPSWYGSQFASGVFHLAPTLMHVSRGLAGVHPFRWSCPPEIAILELQSPGALESRASERA